MWVCRASAVASVSITAPQYNAQLTVGRGMETRYDKANCPLPMLDWHVRQQQCSCFDTIGSAATLYRPDALHLKVTHVRFGLTSLS